ncbi:CYIR protein, partial [Plasmodium cynomolgi strain B]
KIIRNLNDYALWDNSNAKYDVCKLLNYWVYSRLVRIWGSDKPSIITTPLAALHRVWNEFLKKSSNTSLNNKCIPDMGLAVQHNWQDRKKLYDYYVDYDYLLYMAKNYDKDECTYYYKINEMIPLYNFYKDLCSTHRERCPDVFYEFPVENIESELTDLQCYSKFNGINGPILEATSSLQLVDNKGEHEKPAEDISDYIIDDYTVESNTQLDSGNSGIGKKVTHSILGAAPVLLTGTVLYRVCIYFVNIYHYSTNL